MVACWWRKEARTQNTSAATTKHNNTPKNQKQKATNLGPVDALGRVLLLLEREEVARELLLQALVRVVDAQLLKAVGRELLEAVDVEDRDRRACFFWFLSFIFRFGVCVLFGCEGLMVRG